MLKLANSGGAGSTQAWAQRMLEPGTACILDCETTDLDGAIIELAIIDAATGNTLFDSLIDPGGIRYRPRGRPRPTASKPAISSAHRCGRKFSPTSQR